MRLIVTGGIHVEEIDDRPPRLGGSGLIGALAAAICGAEVSLASWVGRSYAEQAFALLDRAGVDRIGVEVLGGSTTTFRISDPGDLSRPLPEVVQGAVPEGNRPALPSAGVVLCFGTPGFDVVSKGWLDRSASGSTLLFDRQGSRSQILGARMAATVPAAQRILLANTHEALAETRAGAFADAVQDLPPAGFIAAVIKGGPWGVAVLEPGRETPIGAHAVGGQSTIGSGDVFGGSLSARLCDGEELGEAARIAVAASAAWISNDEDEPSSNLFEQAVALRTSPSVWVDRRLLEARRFDLKLDASVETGQRDSITRALRYLGIETSHGPNDEVCELDLRGTGSAGRDLVSTVVRNAIELVRGNFGAPTGAQ